MWVCGRGTHSFASSATNLKVSGKMDRMDAWAAAGRVRGPLERITDTGDK